MLVQNSIGFVFEMLPPRSTNAQPISLLRLPSDSEVKPELGDNSRHALHITRCISQLHLVRWVSMNTAPQENQKPAPTKAKPPSPRKPPQRKHPFLPDALHRRRLHLLPGFWASTSTSAGPNPESFFSAGPANFVATENIYRHRERRAERAGEAIRKDPRYLRAWGWCSLVLEIGMWGPAIQREKNVFALRARQLRLPGAADQACAEAIGVTCGKEVSQIFRAAAGVWY